MKEAVIFVRGFVTVDVDKKDKYFFRANTAEEKRIQFRKPYSEARVAQSPS